MHYFLARCSPAVEFLAPSASGRARRPSVHHDACLDPGRAPWRCSDFFFFSHFYFPASGQAVVTGVVPSPPRFLPSIFIAHRVQQSHCSSIFHRVLLSHALALSASHWYARKSPHEFIRVCTRGDSNSRN